jgi:hypothetical protein
VRATFATNSAAWRTDIGVRLITFIKLAAVDQFHAEIAGAITLADLVGTMLG